MTKPATYCSNCGGAIGVLDEGGRPREYCTVCGTIFYRNPLPVASAVVVNARREVLLVKRRQPPQQGMWCLPIGFAELNETIEDAALRELEEEAGVKARVTGLLNVDSSYSDFYGDILVVTFEVEKTGGVERPGDDASALAYFPVAALPDLAFAANEKAVAAYVRGHKEEWEIQDSFRRLEPDAPWVRAGGHGEGGPSSGEWLRRGREGLMSAVLVAMLEKEAPQVAAEWLAEVSANPSTQTLAKIDQVWLTERITNAVKRLSRWMRGAAPPEEIRNAYRRWGREMSAMECPLHEVLSGLSLLKRIIWVQARAAGAWERPVDAYRMLELFTLVGSFFDRAFYQAARGYAEAVHR
ncbi:MAG: NUDIX hydrolase [Gaiellales bacterium]|nr:NUDIX hydrolase [Gaiellales bacterium]